MNSGKTLYQILSVPAAASDGEIRSAHQDTLQKLERHREHFHFEEYESKKKLIQAAYETLSDPLLRRSYDEKLMSRKSGVDKKRPKSTALSLETPENLSNKIDALAFRAEAMALRAEALSMKASLLPYGNALDAQLELPKTPRPVFTWTRLLVVVGAVIALSMAAQTAIFYSAVKKSEAAGSTAHRAQEKAMLQEYYQTYGVRPASIDEMRLFEKERQAKENEEREARAAERQRQREEEDARRFQEQVRSEGERVSSDLRRAEERLRHEEAQEKREKERAEQRLREASENELRQARARWDKSSYGRGY